MSTSSPLGKIMSAVHLLDEHAEQGGDMRRIELVLKGRYRKFRTLSYASVPPITKGILNKWRDQAGLARKEDGVPWEHQVTMNNETTKKDMDKTKSTEEKKQAVVTAGTVVRRQETQRSTTTTISQVGGLGVAPEHDETYLPTDLIRSFCSYFPDTHPYHLSDHCCVCGGSMLFGTQCTTVGELHEPPMLLPNSRFTVDLEGRRAREGTEGGDSSSKTKQNRRDFSADSFIPTNSAMAKSGESHSLTDEVAEWRKQDLEVEYGDNTFMLEDYLRSHNLLNAETSDAKCKHPHDKLIPGSEQAKEFIEGATHGWSGQPSGSVPIDSTSLYSIFTIDDALLLNTIGEGCFCPSSMCLRKQENVDRFFKMGSEFPGGMEVLGFHCPTTSTRVAPSPNVDPNGTYRDTSTDALGSCPATKVPLVTEEQIQRMLYDKDFGLSSVTTPAVVMGDKDLGPHTGLCDMWSGGLTELDDDESEGEQGRRGAKADENDPDVAPISSTVGMCITDCFLRHTGGEGNNSSLEDARSIDDLLAVYEHASFFNHASLDEPQPAATVELACPGVATGWRRYDCDAPPTCEEPSPMLPSTKQNDEAPQHTRSVPAVAAVVVSGASVDGDSATPSPSASRQLPASYWHPDLRALRYRTDWGAVLDFMEEQLELKEKEN